MKGAGRVVVLGLVGGLAAAGCGRGRVREVRASTSPAAPPASRVETETLEIPSLLSVEHEVDLLAHRDGLVAEVARDQGATVALGEVLGRLDDSDARAEVDRARANVAVAEANVSYNQAELKAKQAGHRRALELHGLGLISQADLEKAQFEEKGSEFDIASWKAGVERAAAELRKADLDLGRTRFTSPFPGIVSRRYVRAGQSVAKGDRCFRVSEMGPLQVRFLVPEAARRLPEVGATVAVAAGSGRVYQAKIRKASPVVDAASGAIEVMAELVGPDLGALRPGMATKVLWTAAPAAVP
jgi:RND family efflux transporter MFP subunit